MRGEESNINKNQESKYTECEKEGFEWRERKGLKIEFS